METLQVKLDLYEQQVFDDLTGKGVEPENVLRVLINTVEGDVSQLSEGLKEYAIKNNLIEVN